MIFSFLNSKRLFLQITHLIPESSAVLIVVTKVFVLKLTKQKKNSYQI